MFILLLILSIDCCLVLEGAALLTVFRPRSLCIELIRLELRLRFTELEFLLPELLRFTVPELLEVERVRFTVPELRLLLWLLLITPLLLLLEELLLRLTVPELREVDRVRFTVPELRFVDLVLFTVPRFVLLELPRLRTVDEDRVRFTVDRVRFTLSDRADERTSLRTALRRTLASFRVVRLTDERFLDESALVLGLYVLEGLFTTVLA